MKSFGDNYAGMFQTDTAGNSLDYLGARVSMVPIMNEPKSDETDKTDIDKLNDSIKSIKFCMVLMWIAQIILFLLLYFK